MTSRVGIAVPPFCRMGHHSKRSFGCALHLCTKALRCLPLLFGLTIFTPGILHASERVLPVLAMADLPPQPSVLDFPEALPEVRSYVEHYDPERDDVPPTRLSFIEEQLFWLLDTRNSWSAWVSDTGSRMDAYFAGKQTQSFSNTSFVRIRLGPTFKKQGDLNFDPDIKFRFNLPLTKDKYRIIIENDPDEGKSLSSRTAERISGLDETRRNDTTGTLRVINELKKNWTVTHDLGIRFRFPPDPFVRSKGTIDWQLTPDWSASLLTSVYYFLNEDLGANLITNFDRSLTEALFFRQTFETQWIRDEDKFEHAVTMNLFYELDTHRVLRYRLGMLAESKESKPVSSYYYEMTYREKLYRDWLFYEIIPLLAFPRDDHYKLSPSLTFKLEVLFAKNR